MINATTDAFQDVGELATAYPAIVVPPRPGGIGVAAVGSSHVFRDVRRTVRERASHKDAKCIAVCLGHTRPGQVELTPCPLTAATLEELADKHDSPERLRGDKRKGNGVQVVLALFSEDRLDDEGYRRAKSDHDERAKALKETTSHVERQAMLSQWRTERLPDPRMPFPPPQIVGLLSDTPWQKRD
jgi:hypothetical protein